VSNDASTERLHMRVTRRSVLSLSAGVAILVVSAATAVTLRLVRGNSAAEASATVIMVIGDSLADGLAAGLRRLDRQHRRYTVQNETRIASGLIERDSFDWPATLSALLHAQRPDAVVVLVGLNDARAAAFGSSGWEGDYRARIAAILAVIREASIPAIWVGLPIMRDPDLDRRAEYLDRLYADEVSRQRGARFVDARIFSGGGESSYKPLLPDDTGELRRFRESDGIHFTAFGYEVVANRVVQEIHRVGVISSSDPPVNRCRPA
jgi:hypothetical protein